GIVVVGRLAGGVVHPPGGFERDAVGVGEVDGANGAVVYDVGYSAVGGLEASLECVEGFFVGHVEAQMVELGGSGVGQAGGFGEGFDGGVGVFEEGHRALRAELEEVVAEGGGGDGADQAGAEGSVVEADGGIHVGGNQGEVVDPLPAGR